MFNNFDKLGIKVGNRVRFTLVDDNYTHTTKGVVVGFTYVYCEDENYIKMENTSEKLLFLVKSDDDSNIYQVTNDCIEVIINECKDYINMPLDEARMLVSDNLTTIKMEFDVLELKFTGRTTTLVANVLNEKGNMERVKVKSYCHKEDKFDKARGVQVCLAKLNIKRAKNFLASL